MKRVVLTNLSDKQYENSRFRLNESAVKFGIPEIRSFDSEDLKGSSFYQDNKKILDQPRGLGYWLWKPYLLLEIMKELSEGDIVIYSDSGVEIIGNLAPLIKICREDQPILLFANGNLLNAIWTKRDAFVLMDCDNREYWYGQQCDGAITLFRRSATSIRFLEAWLHYCTDERILTDLPNTSGKRDLPGFIAHRHDQSVLSLLAQKFKIPLYRVPTQFGNHYKMPAFRVKGEFNCINQLKRRQLKHYARKPYYNSPYYQLLYHHRSKNIEESIQRNKPSLKRAIKKLRRGISGKLSQLYYQHLKR